MTNINKHNNAEDLLIGLRDEKYAKFEAKIIPNIAAESIIGVRSPQLQKVAKSMKDSRDVFIRQLPHRWLEENILHAQLLNTEMDYEKLLNEIERFLPYIDNWAVCDSLSPEVFGDRAEDLLPHIRKWLSAEHEYSVRFGIGVLMRYFLDERFEKTHLKMVARVKREEYYVKMMQAWYYATALAKQWEAAFESLQCDIEDEWVKRKSIQKAIESFRVTDEHKNALREYRKNLH